MKSIVPFIVKYSSIKNLVLIPFEKNPDKIYNCFELQYIDGKPNGTGYRIVAYRIDNYVDVYDDVSLKLIEDEKFNVAGNGLHKHVQTEITKTKFGMENGCEHISFCFKDLDNRVINFSIKEFTKKKSKPMNLLAPIGYGTKDPNFMPLFFCYDFDFIRRNKTKVECFIDEQRITIDKFPFPMSMQFRYYVRYSNQSDLLEFGNTDSNSLLEVELDNNSYKEDNVEYIYDEPNSLSSIVVHLEERTINIDFSPSFNMNKDTDGSFTIKPKEIMGYIEGVYSIKKEDEKINIKLVPQNGWKPVPNSFIAKMIMGPKSVFCNWSKNYVFTEEIDIKNQLVKAKWTNNNDVNQNNSKKD